MPLEDGDVFNNDMIASMRVCEVFTRLFHSHNSIIVVGVIIVTTCVREERHFEKFYQHLEQLLYALRGALLLFPLLSNG